MTALLDLMVQSDNSFLMLEDVDDSSETSLTPDTLIDREPIDQKKKSSAKGEVLGIFVNRDVYRDLSVVCESVVAKTMLQRRIMKVLMRMVAQATGSYYCLKQK